MRKSALVAIAALTLLAACAAPFQAKVARFQQLPAPSGQSFSIEAADPKKADGLEFATYANLVRQQLQAQGYTPASAGAPATLKVKLDYGISGGREKIASRPGFISSRFAYGPYGYWPYRYGWGYHPGYWSGFYDPFWGGMYDQEVYSYTVYKSFVDMEIRRDSGDPVFEGRAEADSRSDDLTRLVPNLVQAMFTGFPGNSGETIKVKLPPPARNK